MVELLENTLSDEVKKVIEIGINHKQQHQELLLTDIKYILGNNPLFPIYNKNLLHRINAELEGNFNTDNFIHWESYNPETGTASSYLISTKQHSVNIKALDLKVDFKKWETIHTEISQKYDDDMVEDLAKKSGLSIQFCFQDEEFFYKN